jgi:hypothetical protein
MEWILKMIMFEAGWGIQASGENGENNNPFGGGGGPQLPPPQMGNGTLRMKAMSRDRKAILFLFSFYHLKA